MFGSPQRHGDLSRGCAGQLGRKEQCHAADRPPAHPAGRGRRSVPSGAQARWWRDLRVELQLAASSISEIATSTNEVGGTYTIADHPGHAIVSADNSTLWIANTTADSLGIYSIDDGRLVGSVHTGASPDALAFSADEHLLLAANYRSGDVSVIRTRGSGAPALFTMLPAGSSPVAIVTHAFTAAR